VATRTPGPLIGARIAADVLSNGYLVSTILRSPEMRDVDGLVGALVGAFSSLLGEEDEERADLLTPGDYETMVFRCSEEGEVESWTELDFRRYVTKDEALAGHEEIVGKWLD